MKSKIKMLLLVFFLMVIYCYILAIENLPDKLVVLQGENISMKTLLGLNIKENFQTIETASNNNKSITENPGKATLNVSLFDNIFIKNVNVDILPKTRVIPAGNIAGVKLYTSRCFSSTECQKYRELIIKNINHMKIVV